MILFLTHYAGVKDSVSTIVNRFIAKYRAEVYDK
jgi:hypothetical protein